MNSTSRQVVKTETGYSLLSETTRCGKSIKIYEPTISNEKTLGVKDSDLWETGNPQIIRGNTDEISHTIRNSASFHYPTRIIPNSQKMKQIILKDLASKGGNN